MRYALKVNASLVDASGFACMMVTKCFLVNSNVMVFTSFIWPEDTKAYERFLANFSRSPTKCINQIVICTAAFNSLWQTPLPEDIFHQGSIYRITSVAPILEFYLAEQKYTNLETLKANTKCTILIKLYSMIVKCFETLQK